MLALYSIGVVSVLIAGFYCVMTTHNLIRAVIGVEILAKSVTLLLIVAGHLVGQLALAQALVITLIVIEVAVVVVAVGVVLCIHQHTKSIDSTSIRNIKG
jgi:multisubunit Na+/H+ antiporter MnhC subunit